MSVAAILEMRWCTTDAEEKEARMETKGCKEKTAEREREKDERQRIALSAPIAFFCHQAY